MIIISTREFRANQGKYLKYILDPINEDLDRAITGEELLERVIPRVEKLFDK
jgi:hypothetical protein